MSASHPDQGQRFHGLANVEVGRIKPNPNNPRLIFPQEELDRLAESIATEGVLVPIVVFKQGKEYVLIDGERRFKCALTLGLETIPAVVTEEKSDRDNLVQMFNIHLVREPWQDMPTAWALEKLVKELESEQGKPVTDSQLSDTTGLSKERIQRLRHALELPKQYQKYISDGTIPLNWFWELKRNVIEPLAKERPNVMKDFTAKGITRAFVDKRLRGLIPDTVSLRDVRPIINFAAKDAEENPRGSSILDKTIRELITDPDLTIQMAYEDTVQIMVEADKLERQTKNMLTTFQRLLGRVRTPKERNHVVRIGKAFLEGLRRLIRPT
jgi:ParB family chromosome partitioning protein